MFNVLARLEGFLVSDLDLPFTILFAKHRRSGLFKRVSNGVVGCLHEEDAVSVALLNRSRSDIGRVDLHLLDVRVRINSRCTYQNNGCSLVGTFFGSVSL